MARSSTYFPDELTRIIREIAVNPGAYVTNFSITARVDSLATILIEAFVPTSEVKPTSLPPKIEEELMMVRTLLAAVLLGSDDELSFIVDMQAYRDAQYKTVRWTKTNLGFKLEVV